MSDYMDLHDCSAKGYIALLEQFFIMMGQNAPEDEVNAFLFEAGCNLSRDFAVRTRDTLPKLHLEINSLLRVLGFGVAQIDDEESKIVIRHRQIPTCENKKFSDRWLQCFSIVLCGLYNSWFRQTGAPSALVCRVVELRAPDEAVLVLSKRTRKKS